MKATAQADVLDAYPDGAERGSDAKRSVVRIRGEARPPAAAGRDGQERSRERYEANQMVSRIAAELEERGERRTRELAASRERLRRLADLDPLTGLLSRGGFTRLLDLRITEARATGERFALLVIGLDRFRQVNDTFGHAAGDGLLRHVAMRLHSAANPADVLGRLGGDEFALLVPMPESTDALRRRAEALMSALAAPVAFRDRSIKTSASVGIVRFPDDAETTADLQRYADVALGRAKLTRPSVTLFDAQMSRELQQRQALGAELADAIRSGQIEPWFQPTVDSQSGRATGVEALARWNHPRRGLLAPALFLDLAEERGLMYDLFAHMLRAACPPARRWIDAGLIRTLSINVSPSQFKLGCLADEVTALLGECGFPPQALTVEITEQVLLQDVDKVRAEFERLAAHGVTVALDDFGVGYSNIGYLRQLPFQVLKLDRSLTADVTRERKVRCILSALVQMAAALDLEVVAEGVENPAQARRLARLGCRTLQGYLFGRPMPADELERAIGGVIDPAPAALTP